MVRWSDTSKIFNSYPGITGIGALFPKKDPLEFELAANDRVIGSVTDTVDFFNPTHPNKVAEDLSVIVNYPGNFGTYGGRKK